MWKSLIPLIVVIGVTGGATGASAQDLGTPEGTRTCLCLEEGIARKRDEMTALQRAYDLKRQQLAEMTARLDGQRSTVNTSDPAAVENFRMSLENRDAEAERLDREVLPEYQQSVSSYNDRIARYQQACAGKMYSETVLNQVKATLVCPAE